MAEVLNTLSQYFGLHAELARRLPVVNLDKAKYTYE
jgi:hypothetical protein